MGIDTRGVYRTLLESRHPPVGGDGVFAIRVGFASHVSTRSNAPIQYVHRLAHPRFPNLKTYSIRRNLLAKVSVAAGNPAYNATNGGRVFATSDSLLKI